MNKRTLIINGLALSVLVLPAIAIAHGGIDDGHVEEAVVVSSAPAGASALLRAWSGQWFALLFVSSIITAGLSYWVYRYIQVPPVEKKVVEEKKA